ATSASKTAALDYRAFKAVRSETEMNAVLPLETYKKDVTERVLKEKAVGNEIIILMSGHYVRFEQFYEEGLIENDPGRFSRNRALTPWAEAWRKGYFRGYTVLKR
ncbi:MAG: hypothetical protein KDC44_03685, partial [Phaeodactylibacter sp.]|nr:hypothetical protein [Phaeodactylibacter sp.]